MLFSIYSIVDKRLTVPKAIECFQKLVWMALDSSDLIDIVSDELRVVEGHVPVNSSLAKQFVMIVVFIISSLKHSEMLPLLAIHASLMVLLNTELRHVVIYSTLSRGSSMKQPDWIERSVNVVYSWVRLSTSTYNCFQHVNLGHGLSYICIILT